MTIKASRLRPGPSKDTNNDGKNNIWKVLAIVAFGIVILMATDAIELKVSVSNNGSSPSSSSETSSDAESSGKAMNPQELGAAVEYKTKKEEDLTTTTTNVAGDASTTIGETTGAAESVPAATPGDSGTTPVTSDTTTATVTTPLPADAERHTYQRRGQPMSDADRQAMASKWGSWTLVDTKERPKHDFYKDFPNRDVPRDQFPSNAWQVDKDHLAKFLPESLALVLRAQDAILAEYGKTEGTFEERSQMFQVEQIIKEDLATATGDLEATGKRGRVTGRPSTFQGGWTTPTGWEGLKRRMLHAVMTEDNFVFAMGGHSAAAGHG
jgi:hypothetical protein